MQTVEAAVLYFALVFGAGFVLGTVRTLWLVPRVGRRTAELMESPNMLVVTIFVARWIVLRLAVPPRLSARLGMGGIALILLLVAEFGFMLWLRGLTIREYLASRDRVAGTVYYVMLVPRDVGSDWTKSRGGRSRCRWSWRSSMDSGTWCPCSETTRNGYKMCVQLPGEQFFEAAGVRKLNFKKFPPTSGRPS